MAPTPCMPPCQLPPHPKANCEKQLQAFSETKHLFFFGQKNGGSDLATVVVVVVVAVVVGALLPMVVAAVPVTSSYWLLKF